MSYALTINVKVTDPAKLREAVARRTGKPASDNEAVALMEAAAGLDVPGCEVIEVLGIEGLME